MKERFFALCACWLAVACLFGCETPASPDSEEPQEKAAARVGMDSIVAPGTEPKMLGDKFIFTEGPCWLPTKQGWVFSDIPANKMYFYSAKKGISVFRDPSNFSNGNAIDKDGNLVTAQHDRTVTRTDKDGKVSVIAKEYEGRKLNSPNDLVVAENGDIYFSDPHFGLIGFGPKKGEEEQPVRGIYRLKTDGELELLSGTLKIPNGLDFSPDGKILYATETSDGSVHCFDVKSDGTLGNLRLFAEQPTAEKRRPIGDGVRVDRKGNVYAAAPAGVAIYTPQGKLIGQIFLAESPSNLAWGGEDRKTLFITACNKVYTMETLVGGR